MAAVTPSSLRLDDAQGGPPPGAAPRNHGRRHRRRLHFLAPPGPLLAFAHLVDREPQLALDELLEQIALAPRRPDLQLWVTVRVDADLHRARRHRTANRAHQPRVR